MKIVRAKFRCSEVVKSVSWQSKNIFLYTAKFSAVVGDSEENKKFFDATPQGLINIGTYKEDVFEVGKEYFIDFVKCEDVKAGTQEESDPPPPGNGGNPPPPPKP